jgi:predicted esterase
LNRFYVEQTPGPHGPDSRVGATWMTREDRLREIEDYVGYLDTLSDEIFRTIPRDKVSLTVLGFSQGVATVARWAVHGRTRPDHLILWAERLPPEIDLGAGAEELAAIPRLSVVVGLKDLEAQRVLSLEKDRFQRLGLRYAHHSFDGGHHLDEDTLRKLAQE